MNQHYPPHPGEILQRLYLEPQGISLRELARRLDVAPSTLSRLLGENHSLTPEMALRLEHVLGNSAQSWLTLQMHHDLWRARREFSFFPPDSETP